jgi:hypothetical protein
LYDFSYIPHNANGFFLRTHAQLYDILVFSDMNYAYTYAFTI